MDRTGIYLRISQDIKEQDSKEQDSKEQDSKEQDSKKKDSKKKGAGVARQLKDCRAMCEAKGFTIEDIYKDNDRSATNGKEREHWDRLFRDVESGRINHIVAWARDRLSRDTVDTGLLERLAKRYGVIITIHPGTTYDLTDPAALLNFQIQGAVGGFESGQKIKRQKARAEQDFAEGLPYLRRSIFGYDPNPAKIGRKNENPFDLTIINEEEASAIRWAYEQVNSGNDSLVDIAKEWNRRGLTTKSGKLWDSVLVSRTLRNPAYGGIQSRSLREGHGSWELFLDIETHWTPLLDREDWLKARTVLDIRRAKYVAAQPKRTPRKSWLSGLVRCAEDGCTGTMVRNGARYACQGGNPHSPSIQATRLEPTIEDYILRQLEWMAGRSRMVEDPDAAELVKLREQLNGVELDLGATPEIKDRALRIREQNRLTQLRDTMNEELARRLSSRSIASVVEDLTNPIQNRRWSFERSKSTHEAIREAWDGMSVVQRNRVADILATYSVRGGHRGEDRVIIVPRPKYARPEPMPEKFELEYLESD